MTTHRKIGMIGIGMMGHGIASNLIKHGHALTVLDHPGNQPIDDLVSAGVTVHHQPREVAAEVDIVMLCVTGSPQVEAVLLSEHGVLQGIRPGTVVIDCSTAIPSSTERLARIVSERGARFMDAEIGRAHV